MTTTLTKEARDKEEWWHYIKVVQKFFEVREYTISDTYIGHLASLLQDAQKEGYNAGLQAGAEISRKHCCGRPFNEVPDCKVCADGECQEAIADSILKLRKV